MNQTNPSPATSPRHPDRRLPILLRRAWFGLNQAFRRRIATAGMTPGQFTALRTLIENGDLTQRSLTEIMSSDANTIASLLSRMEKVGWLKRETHERDRRANRLHVTPAGKRKFAAVKPIAADLQESVLNALSQKQRAEFLECLATVADACQEESDADVDLTP
jgi:DNA-binding MarR family transcriptional regulator